MNKRTKVMIFGVASLLGFSWSYCQAAAPAPEKYAFVDIAKVFDEYQKTKDNDKTLQELGKKKEQERDAMVQEVKQLKDELALLNNDAKTKKQEAVDDKIRALQEFDNKARQELGQQRNKIVREIFQDIDDTVKRYGERKGIDFIFNERAMVYHNAKYDVTQDVLAELNQGAAKKK